MPLRKRKQWWGVTLDAPDGKELARFYARLLDWELFEKEGEEGAAVAPPDGAGYNLGFQSEPHYVRPVWPAEAGKQQMLMHLEIEVDDLEEAVAHAVAVGAEVAAYQPQSTRTRDARSRRPSLLPLPRRLARVILRTDWRTKPWRNAGQVGGVFVS